MVDLSSLFGLMLALLLGSGEEAVCAHIECPLER